MKELADVKLAVVGLGYVGLPLAVEFGKKIPALGYDIDRTRVDELKNGFDRTLEVSSECLRSSHGLSFSCERDSLQGCNVFIITVPTPIDAARRPDFDPLLKSSAAIGSILKRGDIVIYESTVYPGVTEEVCVPVLEKASGLVYNEDFYCGYSPERINPGDKERSVVNIIKVTSGSTPEVADFVDRLYSQIIIAGTHKASSIRVAEAAKVIENTQRDVNIALMNELARIFNRIGIDTQEVLAAAGTKWNFIKLTPGLVGGHCIGVDPYYLAHKAAMLGYNPELILAARRINDEMASYVADRLLREMVRRSIDPATSSVLIAGATFKEDCPDLRNSKSLVVYEELRNIGIHVQIYDPHVDADDLRHESGVELITNISDMAFDAVVLAVPHAAFFEGETGVDMHRVLNSAKVIFDLKGRMPVSDNAIRL